jgi:hypothetical protein
MQPKEKSNNVSICGVDCKYRIFPEGLSLQRNALRVESMSPSQRCGKNLKENRIGGRWDDYHPCDYPVKNNSWV